MKERNFNRCSLLPNPNSYPWEKKKVVLFVIIEMTCVLSLARASYFQIWLQMKWQVHEIKGKRVIPHTGFILKVFLDHFWLHKPEGSKSSQYCDVTFKHMDSPSDFTSSIHATVVKFPPENWIPYLKITREGFPQE